MKKSTLNQKGQALLETVVALPLLAIATVGLIGTAYLALGLKLFSHWVYQANLCLAKDYSVLFCKRNFQQQSQLLPGFQLTNLKFGKSGHQVTVTGSLKYLRHNTRKFSNTISLPISPNKRP